VSRIVKLREPDPQSEAGILERLDRWRETLGEPMGNGRNNPDNDMFYLLADAALCIRGLRQYARRLEAARISTATPSQEDSTRE
jgi:hypothetical protein